MNILKRKNKKEIRLFSITTLVVVVVSVLQLVSLSIQILRIRLKRTHNKEALALLQIKKGQVIIERQSIGTPFIPSHKFKANFLQYYQEYVEL